MTYYLVFRVITTRFSGDGFGKEARGVNSTHQHRLPVCALEPQTLLQTIPKTRPLPLQHRQPPDSLTVFYKTKGTGAVIRKNGDEQSLFRDGEWAKSYERCAGTKTYRPPDSPCINSLHGEFGSSSVSTGCRCHFRKNHSSLSRFFNKTAKCESSDERNVRSEEKTNRRGFDEASL